MFGSKGYLDFYINSGKKWGVEFVCESDKLLEHINRKFGKYSKIPLVDYLVVNVCQITKPEAPLPGELQVIWNRNNQKFTVRRDGQAPDVYNFQD